MQHRYSGDIGDFGKFLLLKRLFPQERIATIWYLYPDETHNNDGSHKVHRANPKLFERCSAIDPQMSALFDAIHESGGRHVDRFAQLGVLERGVYFSEPIIGEGRGYRARWLKSALECVTRHDAAVVCLDPDNGVEPLSMQQYSTLKQGKYATYAEIETFFALPSTEYVVIYQHFHRQHAHQAQMQAAKERFEHLYARRGRVEIIRHHPLQARFYILLCKTALDPTRIDALSNVAYGEKRFFSVGADYGG